MNRIPVIVRAVVAGLAVGVVVTVPWAILAAANLRQWPAVPWSVAPALLYLWRWWKWVRGEGWPRSTAAIRRANLRARALSDDAWGVALAAGVLGVAAALIVLQLTNRLATIPQQAIPDLARIPLATLLSLHLTGSAIAGIVEEASFRGYMQAPIERTHGPVVAILITGVVFGLAHVGHPGLLAMMLFYLTLSATYGTLAYLTDPIVPSMVIHAVGHGLGGLTALTQGTQTSSLPLPAVDAAGSPGSVWLAVAGVIVVGGATLWAFRALAAVARQDPVVPVGSPGRPGIGSR